MKHLGDILFELCSLSIIAQPDYSVKAIVRRIARRTIVYIPIIAHVIIYYNAIKHFKSNVGV